MIKIISLMHISLDGFAAVPNGDMNWVKVDEAPKGMPSAKSLILSVSG